MNDIDKILSKFQYGFSHQFTDPKGGLSQEETESKVYSLLMDVIGEDEQPHDIRLMDTNTAIFLNNKIAFCNRLRAEQRQKLNQLFNKEK